MANNPLYDVFLSHNSADKAEVELIARRLEEEAGLNPFLDKWHLIPGQPWQDALAEGLESSASVAVFIGPSGVSPWHNEELRAALARAVRNRDEYRVIPVLLPGASAEAVSTFLAQRTWVDFRSGLEDEEAFQRLVAGIKGEATHVGAYELPDDPAPYRGLLPFEAEQAAFFFGREEETQDLVARINQYPFIAVIGASGSGKSSLVRAGLLAALSQDALPESSQWHTLVFTPGSDPLHALAAQLSTFVPIAERVETADRLAARMAKHENGFRTAAATLLARDSHPLLLVIDQFEEVFTHCQSDEARCRQQREAFIANLADAIQSGDDRTRILLTLRADFLEHCLAFPRLKDLFQDRQFLLGPLGEPELRDAIVRPAQLVGAFLEKGLLGTILRDVRAQPGSLPLLQHALYELWQARRGPWLTLEAYEDSGGVQGALGRRAQATYQALSQSQQNLARNIFLRLTALGEGISDTRRRARRSELYPLGADPEQVDAVIQSLSGPKARLVVADQENVEVAHEMLIHSWPTLQEWLETDRQALRVHRKLTEATHEWDENKRDASYLYRGVRLAETEAWLGEFSGKMSRLEQAFLEASRAERDRELRAAAERQQRALEVAQQLNEALQQRAEAQARAARRLWLLVALLIPYAIAVTIFAAPNLWRLLAPGELVSISGGTAAIGSDQGLADPSEKPVWQVEVAEFEIEKYEVTNRQYCLCVRAGVCSPPLDPRSCQDEVVAELPVVNANAFQAETYCRWIDRRLPTEVEWEWAAQGVEERPWPWGNAEPDSGRLNVGSGLDTDLTLEAVDSYLSGATPEGVHNLAGNALEWTASVYQAYPYDPQDPQSIWTLNSMLTSQELNLAIRGGSFKTDLHSARPTHRLNARLTASRDDLGFRCAK